MVNCNIVNNKSAVKKDSKGGFRVAQKKKKKQRWFQAGRSDILEQLTRIDCLEVEYQTCNVKESDSGIKG